MPEATDDDIKAKTLGMPSLSLPIEMLGPHHARSISISMPTSPSAFDVEHSKAVLENENGVSYATGGQTYHPIGATASLLQQKQAKFHSQPIPVGNSHTNMPSDIKSDHLVRPQQMPRNCRFKDKRYDSFKTWSGKLERQLSNLRGKPQELEEVNDSKNTKPEAVPADRFFDALEGPELDKLKVPFEVYSL